MAREVEFRELLRRHRLMSGLTQEELAERAGLSLRGLSDLERGVRRLPHRTTTLRLADALGLGGAERVALLASARRQRARSETSAVAHTSRVRLPIPQSSFVARERELGDIRRLVGERRLVTLTGPGGTGKTRLALQVAAEAAGGFYDGAVFVPLNAITDPQFVLSAIAQSFALQDADGRAVLDRLIDGLHGKRVLLVLDNFEHVLDAAPSVTQLLGEVPGLKVLATSREPLRLHGEYEYPVPPLALPDAQQELQAQALREYGAVALFVERARAIQPNFLLNEDNAAAVAEICRRVDGLPLAIELAAARMRVLSPQAILPRLQRRLDLLTGGPRDVPPRQQTLRATIAWSYDLLEEAERSLFRRLSIFAGGSTLEAGEAVAGGDYGCHAVFDCSSSLVAKSLLLREDGPDYEPRIGMLETIREFGLEQLEASGEVEAVRSKHANYFVTLAERAEPQLLGSEQVVWLQRLSAEYENLRAVLAWSRDGHISGELGLRLAGALPFFWSFTGVASEAREWAERMLALPAAGAPTRARARALVTASRMANLQNDSTAARGFAAEGIAILRQIGDTRELVRALITQTEPEIFDGDYAAAHASADESLALAQQIGDAWGTAWAWSALGAVLQQEGDYELARRSREQAASMARSLGDRVVLGIALAALAHLARQAGDGSESEQLYREALLVSADLGPFWRVIPRVFAGLAGAASMRGDFVRSARLLGAAEGRWESSGKRESAFWRATVDADVAAVRNALGSRSFIAARAQGRGWTMDEALEYALDTPGLRAVGITAAAGR